MKNFVAGLLQLKTSRAAPGQETFLGRTDLTEVSLEDVVFPPDKADFTGSDPSLKLKERLFSGPLCPDVRQQAGIRKAIGKLISDAHEGLVHRYCEKDKAPDESTGETDTEESLEAHTDYGSSESGSATSSRRSSSDSRGRELPPRPSAP